MASKLLLFQGGLLLISRPLESRSAVNLQDSYPKIEWGMSHSRLRNVTLAKLVEQFLFSFREFSIGMNGNSYAVNVWLSIVCDHMPPDSGHRELPWRIVATRRLFFRDRGDEQIVIKEQWRSRAELVSEP